MNVVMVAAECAPWSKTGGLGDVAQSLPKAMAARGHRTMCVVPLYDEYEGAHPSGVTKSFSVCGSPQEVAYWHCCREGVDWVFVDHQVFRRLGGAIYSGSRAELNFRMALLCKAALEAVWHVPCGTRGVYGDENLMFVANDWHTALLPVYLQAHYRDYNQFEFARCVLIIHNIAHQGRGPVDDFYSLEVPEHYKELFYLDDPWGGECSNVLKAGLLTAHRVVAVSKGYAWEIQTDMGGWGLAPTIREMSWKLSGVVNGIDMDEWDPASDTHLHSEGYTNYDLGSLAQKKSQCKVALQRQLGLPEDPGVPVLGFIGRLDEQKGVDLIRDSVDHIVSRGAQLILLGSGRPDLEEDLRAMENNHREQVRSWVGFSVEMAHRITAGADILLMPSRFEPCGLNQLYAMRYGTIPVVHAVGGLRDTVHPYSPYDNSGTGWQFSEYDVHNFQHAIDNALNTYYDHRESFQDIQRRGMGQDLSWEHAALEYEKILIDAKYQW